LWLSSLAPLFSACTVDTRLKGFYLSFPVTNQPFVRKIFPSFGFYLSYMLPHAIKQALFLALVPSLPHYSKVRVSSVREKHRD